MSLPSGSTPISPQPATIHAELILGGRRKRVARGLDESVEDLVLCAGRGIEPSGCFGLALESGPPGPPNARLDAPERRRGHLSGTSELPGLGTLS